MAVIGTVLSLCAICGALPGECKMSVSPDPPYIQSALDKIEQATYDYDWATWNLKKAGEYIKTLFDVVNNGLPELVR
jgi:hypothetical protein